VPAGEQPLHLRPASLRVMPPHGHPPQS
jgi:hypothetical protein